MRAREYSVAYDAMREFMKQGSMAQSDNDTLRVCPVPAAHFFSACCCTCCRTRWPLASSSSPLRPRPALAIHAAWALVPKPLARRLCSTHLDLLPNIALGRAGTSTIYPVGFLCDTVGRFALRFALVKGTAPENSCCTHCRTHAACGRAGTSTIYPVGFLCDTVGRFALVKGTAAENACCTHRRIHAARSIRHLLLLRHAICSHCWDCRSRIKVHLLLTIREAWRCRSRRLNCISASSILSRGKQALTIITLYKSIITF